MGGGGLGLGGGGEGGGGGGGGGEGGDGDLGQRLHSSRRGDIPYPGHPLLTALGDTLISKYIDQSEVFPCAFIE